MSIRSLIQLPPILEMFVINLRNDGIHLLYNILRFKDLFI